MAKSLKKSMEAGSGRFVSVGSIEGHAIRTPGVTVSKAKAIDETFKKDALRKLAARPSGKKAPARPSSKSGKTVVHSSSGRIVATRSAKSGTYTVRPSNPKAR